MRELRAAGWLAAAAVALAALVLVHWTPLAGADRTVAGELHRVARTLPGLTEANRVLSDWVWDPWTVRAALLVLVGWLVWRGVRVLAAWVAATSALGTLLQQGIKAAVDRPRPVWPDPVDAAHYASFPSGHAMTAMVGAGLALWVLRERAAPAAWQWAVGVPAAVSVVGVGCTRLYLGVHWLSDVLAGWLLGAALVAAAAGLYTRLASAAATRPPDQD
ncbi:phosphatase PAP2 family protein [Streptomyces sp. Ru73]|uniref:phosphatase PAP2 family protein n=1 Tax=Streptomyces sp. Ru73 TaxID=2080748 RepID=UPI002156609B|nr:phosphatase PAP2 family protein [Streptomyces sp. Ru73]